MKGKCPMSQESKVVILSDLHLTADGGPLLGIDTAGRLARAVERIGALHCDAAAVIFAGDISEDGSAASYALFAKLVAGLTVPWVATPGNHDDRTMFARIATPHAATGRFDSWLSLPGGDVAVLDTQVEGAHHGAITPAQAEWLAGHPMTRAGLVVTHHPVPRLGIWTDCMRLTDPAPLAHALAAAAPAPTLLAGHIHMTSFATWQGMPALTLAGNHFSVAPILDTVPEPRATPLKFHDGPAEYAVALLRGTDVVVHFETYVRDNAPFDEARVTALLSGA